MKIKELNGEQSLEALEGILIPLANIGEDTEVLQTIVEAQPRNDESKLTWYARCLRLLPKVLKNHKSDLLLIFATLHCKDYDEYNEETNMFKLAKDLMDLLQDEDIKVFFG